MTGQSSLRVELYAISRIALSLIPDVGRVFVSEIEEAVRKRNSAGQKRSSGGTFQISGDPFEALNKLKL